jgi:hypothetical protein
VDQWDTNGKHNEEIYLSEYLNEPVLLETDSIRCNITERYEEYYSDNQVHVNAGSDNQVRNVGS